MPFCPFFSTNCPESGEGDTGCAIWTDFGCCMIDKPGIPCEWSGVSPSVDVFILEIKTTDADPQTEILIIYALASDGSIHVTNTMSDFKVHKMY